MRSGVPLAPVLRGGGQENERRSGTQNVPAIVGLGEASRLLIAERQATAERVAELRDRLEEESLATDFAFANRVRDSIPRDAKGFIHQLNEILVQAEDRPGILAEIATAMREESININDIEIVKVREGEGGTIRLGFDAEDAAQRALDVLHGLGYQARRP